MTRQQVAQRLGKSVATVRRIEGVLLHPTQDSRGTHRFDDDEVEALARGIESGQVTLWQELRRASAGATGDSPVEFESANECAKCSELHQELDALRDELEEQRRRQRELKQFEAERAKHYAERREFEMQVAEFMATVSSLG